MAQVVRVVVPSQVGVVRERVAFRAIIMLRGAAQRSRPCRTVAEAITWAEQVSLD